MSRALLQQLAGLRPLPLSIVVMVLLALCKLAGVILGVSGPGFLDTASRAVLPVAQAVAHEAPPPAKPSQAASKPPPAAAGPEAEKQMPLENLAVAAPTVDPAAAEAERTLLQELRARRVQLDERTQAVAKREALLAAAEIRLSERVDQLAIVQARLEALETTRRERDEANWRGLVKTYEAMRPRDAAAIFNELEQPVLMQVLDRMKEAKAALVLAAMQPERARAATAQLAQWRTRTPGGPQG